MANRLASLLHGMIVLAAAGSPLAAACSGGSGGTGYGFTGTTPPTDPVFTPSSTAFPDTLPSTDAAKDHRVLVVLQHHRTPLGIWDANLASQSKAMPFVLFEDGAAEQFASRWEIDTIPAVALCDQAGNVLAFTSSPITAQHITQLVSNSSQEQTVLQDQLHATYQHALAAVISHHVTTALADLDLILHYKTFPVCDQATTLKTSILQQGHDAVASALTGTDPGHSRSTLTELIRTYHGTVVADEARKALHTLE